MSEKARASHEVKAVSYGVGEVVMDQSRGGEPVESVVVHVSSLCVGRIDIDEDGAETLFPGHTPNPYTLEKVDRTVPWTPERMAIAMARWSGFEEDREYVAGLEERLEEQSRLPKAVVKPFIGPVAEFEFSPWGKQ